MFNFISKIPKIFPNDHGIRYFDFTVCFHVYNTSSYMKNKNKMLENEINIQNSQLEMLLCTFWRLECFGCKLEPQSNVLAKGPHQSLTQHCWYCLNELGAQRPFHWLYVSVYMSRDYSLPHLFFVGISLSLNPTSGTLTLTLTAPRLHTQYKRTKKRKRRERRLYLMSGPRM